MQGCTYYPDRLGGSVPGSDDTQNPGTCTGSPVLIPPHLYIPSANLLNGEAMTTQASTGGVAFSLNLPETSLCLYY